jgi:1,4-dihydroxy-2-naphthoate polyprenyltransferase
MNFFKKWAISLRAPFLTASIVPVVFGTTLAWHSTGNFNFIIALVTLLGVAFAHAGTNLSNDYFDHKTTDDDINETPTPFSGGSRMIQDKIQTPAEVLTGGLVFFGLALLCGIYLWLKTTALGYSSYIVPLIAVIGFLSGFLYTATPIKIGYRGWGEFFIGLNFGTLAVMGSYFVQTGKIGWMPVITSIPIAFLITAVVYINQYPDYEADKTVRKRHWVVRLGKKKAIPGYLFLMFGSYIASIVAILLDYMPLFSLIVFITLPLTIGAVKTLYANYDKIDTLLPANAATIKIHLSYGLLMVIGVVADKLI